MPDSPRAWRTVLDRIEHDLLSGRLHPGDRLPGERVLAAELGVGRSSVREALRVLDVMGLLTTATGSGPQSGAIIVARPGGGMSALMRLQAAAQGFDARDIVDTRITLESAVARTLAERADPALDDARLLIEAMNHPDTSRAQFLVLDTRFHLALAEAAGNQVIVATMAGLRSAVEGYISERAAVLPSWERTSARLHAEHGEILDAIAAGEPDRAAALIAAHITGYYTETLPELDSADTPVPPCDTSPAPEGE